MQFSTPSPHGGGKNGEGKPPGAQALPETAETGTIEGSRPLTYVRLSSQDSRKARCRVTFDMRALRPEVFHRQLAPGKTLTIHYGPMRVVNRMSIDVHCTPMHTITKPAPETD